jgi:hypothetical protein
MSFVLHWPQLTYLAITVVGLSIYAARHGQPRKDKYNVGTSLIAVVIVLTILYFGGFFRQ